MGRWGQEGVVWRCGIILSFFGDALSERRSAVDGLARRSLRRPFKGLKGFRWRSDLIRTPKFRYCQHLRFLLNFLHYQLMKYLVYNI